MVTLDEFENAVVKIWKLDIGVEHKWWLLHGVRYLLSGRFDMYDDICMLQEMLKCYEK